MTYLNARTKKLSLIVYLAALSAFAAFSTDAYLAAMPTIQRLFATSMANVQLTLSLFFIGFALAQLFWGPLSDRIGRKPVVLIGISIYVVASLLCAWSSSLEMLIFARLLQAIGACSGIVMALAMVRDFFPESREMAKILSIITSIMILTPIVAPIVGSYLLVHINWHAIFYFLALYGLLLVIASCFLTESHPRAGRKPLPVNQLFSAYVSQFKFLPFLLAVIAISTNFSVLFSFISSASFIYIKIYHLPTKLFGYFFSVTACSLIFGSLSLHRLKSIGVNQSVIISVGLVLTLSASIGMYIAISMAPHSIWHVMVPSIAVCYGVGLLLPELTACALSHVVDYTGLASSLAGLVRYVIAAFVSFIMGIVINQTALPLAVVMIILSSLTFIAMLIYLLCFRR